MLKRLLSTFVLLVYIKSAFAQSSTQSPYSYYGIGDLQYQGSAAQIGMAGLSYSYSDSLNINFNNPASYSALRLTVFDVAVRLEHSSYKTSSQRTEDNNGTLSYLNIGFPVIYKKWGTSIGLLPYAATGYSLKTVAINSDNVIYTNTYTGNGGVNRLYWGNGFAINKNLSAGLNVSYFFGTVTKGRNTEFAKSGYYNSSSYVSTHYNNMGFNLGLLYKTDSLFSIKKDYFQRYVITDSITTNGDTLRVKKDLYEGLTRMQQRNLKAYRWLRFNFGLTGNLSNNIDVSSDVYNHSYKYNNAGVPIQRDTILYSNNAKAETKMPAFIGGGISLQDVNHWLVGIDANYQKWSDFSTISSDSLNDAYKIAIGGEFTPKYNSVNYWERVNYRVGTRFARTQINLQNTPINDYAFTFGFGFPIRKDAITTASSVYQTRINVAFEIGSRGTTQEKLLKENYFRLTIGLNFTEKWFVKRKYD